MDMVLEPRKRVSVARFERQPGNVPQGCHPRATSFLPNVLAADRRGVGQRIGRRAVDVTPRIDEPIVIRDGRRDIDAGLRPGAQTS